MRPNARTSIAALAGSLCAPASPENVEAQTVHRLKAGVLQAPSSPGRLWSKGSRCVAESLELGLSSTCHRKDAAQPEGVQKINGRPRRWSRPVGVEMGERTS